MEKGAQSYPGQVLAAGGTQVACGQDASCPRAGRKCPWAGRKLPVGGMKVARGRDAGGTLSRPACLLEVSIRRRKGVLCKPSRCLTLLN